MLAVVKSATPFFEGAHFYYGAGAILAVITISKVTGLTRYVRKKWRNYRNWILVRDGKAAIPNVSKEILSIPVRLKNLDDGQLKILDEITTYKTEHSIEVGRIASAVELVVESNEALVAKVQKLFPNGENTNDPGDLLSRTAKAVGAFLPNPSPVAHDRREGDDKEAS